MSTIIAPIRAPYPWPGDVLEFARRHGVTTQLNELLEVTRTLFSRAAKIDVVLEHDPELADMATIVFRVWVARFTLDDVWEKNREWHNQRCRFQHEPDPGVFALVVKWSKP